MGLISARRSWLFLPGADREPLLQAATCGTDVAIQDLEDFTPATLKERARGLSAEICAHWMEHGVEPAVRVRPLEEGGHVDTEAAVAAGAAIVVLAKAENGDEVRALDRLISYHEGRAGRAHGVVEVCPTVESPGALLRLQEIASASTRVTSAILASEDLATNLGVSRTIDSTELHYARSRFRLEAAAAGILAVDCPFTFDDAEGAVRDLTQSAALGYRAKSLVRPGDAPLVNSTMGPDGHELERAAGLVAAFEQASAEGRAQVVFEGRIVELSAYTAATRLLASEADRTGK
nr:aldolase/citrate lyase family protein [Ornithinimicrobium cavernae]